MLRRLGRQAEQAAAYKDIAGPEWGPRLGALVCCAHFLEHHLREGPPPLLLLDLQARAPSDCTQVQNFSYKSQASRLQRDEEMARGTLCGGVGLVSCAWLMFDRISSCDASYASGLRKAHKLPPL